MDAATGREAKQQSVCYAPPHFRQSSDTLALSGADQRPRKFSQGGRMLIAIARIAIARLALIGGLR